MKAIHLTRQAGARVAFDPNERPALWTSPKVMGSTITAAATIADIVLPTFPDEAATFGDEANRIVNCSATFYIGIEYLVNSLTVLVVGPRDDAKTKELMRAYWGKPTPNGLVVQMEAGEPLPPGHPATGRGMEGGQPTAYICQAGGCSAPYTSAAALSEALTLPPQLREQQSA